LTNIRDEPKPALELDEARAASMSLDELAEQREEINRLLAGLRELPEPQRAAIVKESLPNAALVQAYGQEEIGGRALPPRERGQLPS